MIGAAVGGVRSVLRLEGLCICAASILAYSKYGAGWGVFFSCFLIPDLSFIGYLAGSRVGACAYNFAHSYVGPAVCFALALSMDWRMCLTASLIWSAHIGFDRALGYGLKYEQGFGYTHLGLIGRAAQEAVAPLIKPQPAAQRDPH